LIAALFMVAALPSAAAYLQPFVYYGIDQGGSPLTNLITIQAVGTNTITAYSTFIVASVPKTYQPDVNGYVSNNIALGNYILTISNYYYSVPFSISSNAAPQNISQVAGIPVTTFMNFTLAQFSDAGTMARESTNNWTRSGAALAYSQLPFTPPTNTPAGLVAVLGFQPATNNAATNTVIYISGLTTFTNAAGAVTNVTFTLGTNTLIYQHP